MLAVSIRLVAGGVLVAAAIAKIASPATSRAALGTLGIAGRHVQMVVWALLVTTEIVLGAGVIAGSEIAAWLAASLMAVFAATMVSAIMRGRAGAPCACFGARSTVGWRSVARNALLAAAFATVPFLPDAELSSDEWLALGLGVALVALAALAAVVLALAREVGLLRLRLGPGSALEIEGEGPPLGSRVDAIERFDLGAEAALALAVFTSDGCHVCHGLRPAIQSLAGDPRLAVETFEEAGDAGVWSELGIPGSPYAVALGPDGTVLAKGTFNNLAQLESVLATAERRRPQREGTEVTGA